MIRVLSLALSIAALTFLPALSRAGTTLPQGPLPAGLRAVDAGGGRIVEGSLVNVHSAADAFGNGLRRVGPYFDRRPHIESAVRSTDGTLTVGLFRASVSGRPVAGLLFAIYGKSASSRVAAAFDRPDHLRSSLRPLLSRLYAMAPPARSAAGRVVKLEPHVSPDQSVGMAIPSDWKLPLFAQGVAVAVGPHGEEVDKQVTINYVDPRGPVYQSALNLARSSGVRPQLTGFPMQYIADAAKAYVATARILAQQNHQSDPQVTLEQALPVHDPYAPSASVDQIVGTRTEHGVRLRFMGNVMSAPPNQFGAWQVAANLVSAPQSSFKAEFPVLKAINESYVINQRVRGEQVHATIVANDAGIARNAQIAQQTQARNAAVFNASMSHARAVQDGIDRSSAGFTRYLSDSDVVENVNTGQRATVDYNFADAIVKNDPQAFRTVPVSEYRRGSEY